jgi:hypothetical protein
MSEEPREKNLLYVFALPKSGSRYLCESLIAAKPEGLDFQLRSPPAPLNQHGYLVNMEVDTNFVPQAGDGLVHSHAAPLPINVGLLKDLKTRYIVTVRHPADHIAALYCHLRKNLPIKMRPGAATPRYSAEEAPLALKRERNSPAHWHSVIAPVAPEAMLEATPVEDGIDYLIAEGYLFCALKWITDWLWYRSDKESMVVRYEDLMRDTSGALNQCCAFLSKRNPGAEPFSVRENVEMEPVREWNPFHYPKGYSGEVGIWRSYLSGKNAAAYNDITTRFIDLYPPAKVLKKYYPDVIV